MVSLRQAYPSGISASALMPVMTSPMGSLNPFGLAGSKRLYGVSASRAETLAVNKTMRGAIP